MTIKQRFFNRYFSAKPKAFLKSRRLCLALLIMIRPALAAFSTPTFFTLDASDGLSHNSVTTLLQDHTGFLWIGTQGGLNRYDGQAFAAFHHNPADTTTLSSEIITALYQDRENRLWIGTEAGLDLFIPPASFQRIATGHVTAIFQDRHGTLWFAFTEECLYTLDPPEQGVRQGRMLEAPRRRLSIKHVSAFAQDRTGALWIATCANELISLTRETDSLAVFRLPGSARPVSNSGCTHQLAADDDGRLWLATARGLYVFEKGQISPFGYNLSPSHAPAREIILALCFESNRVLWTGAQNTGLARIDLQTHECRHFELPACPGRVQPAKITALLIDSGGILWAGTDGGGLIKAVPGRITVSHSSEFVRANVKWKDPAVWSFAKAPQRKIWVGSSSGVYLYDPISRTIADQPLVSRTLRGAQIRGLWMENDSTLWIATQGKGLYEWRFPDGPLRPFKFVNTSHPQLHAQSIYALDSDGQGGLWLGAIGAGLLRFDLKSKSYHRIILPGTREEMETSTWVTGLWFHGPDELWFTTWLDGLWRLNLTDQRLTQIIPHEPGTPGQDHPLLSLAITDSITVWIGTYGSGLCRYNLADRALTCFAQNAGLADNVIFAIEPDAFGGLWLGSNRGLIQFDPQTARSRTCDDLNGLMLEEFNLGASLRCDNGDFYFGAARGFYSFHPHNYKNAFAPKIAVAKVQTNLATHEYYLPPEEMPPLRFRADERMVRLSFSGLHFADPDRNRYAYFLEGFDQGWNEVDQRGEAVYTNLPPGRYKLFLKAANSDGIWSVASTGIAIQFAAPYWRAWWFWLIVALTVCALAYVYYRTQLNHARALERTRVEERELLRAKIAQDFHDEMGHRLSKILLFSKTLRKNESQLSDHAEAALEKIIDNSEALGKEMREFIWELDPQKDSLYDLLVQLKKFSDDLYDKTEIAFQLKGVSPALEAIQLPLSWRAHILRIFKEAMVNVLKHVPECRQIVLETAAGGDLIVLRLINDGGSFDPLAAPTGNGLKNMRSRAEKIGGRLSIVSANGTTMVELTQNYPLG